MTTQSPAASTSGRLVRIWRSTAMAPRTPSSAPAAAASSVSGRTPTETSTTSAGKSKRLARRAVGRARPPARGGASRACLFDRVDARVALDVDAVALKFGADERAELGIDGGKHLGELLDLGDGEPAGRERLGHLEADVAGADDHRPPDARGSRECASARTCRPSCAAGAPRASGPSWSSPAIGGRSGTAPVPMISAS